MGMEFDVLVNRCSNLQRLQLHGSLTAVASRLFLTNINHANRCSVKTNDHVLPNPNRL